MPRFSYVARSRSGEKLEGSVEANDKRSALLQVERMGHVPISVEDGGALLGQAAKTPGKKKAFSVEFSRGKKSRMKMRDVVLFTRELSDLLSSGMKLGNALHTLSNREMPKAQDEIITGLRDEVVQGTSLSDALAKRPDTFSPLFVNLVRAGEASGQMSSVLERICSYNEMVQEAQEKVIGALIYPGIVLTMGIGTMIFTMIFVVPRFSSIFEELGRTLPLPTQILISTSSIMLNYGWIVAIALVVGIVLFRRMIRTLAGRKWWDRTKLRIPIISDVLKANAFAQFARTLESLLENGVPVLQALTIVEDTVGNAAIAEEIREARNRVTDGASISAPLAQGKIFPRLLTDMLAVGEESGNVSGALGHIGKRYETELDRTVKILTTVLEPILILLMAIMVGFVAVSMLMAVFDLTSGLNV